MKIVSPGFTLLEVIVAFLIAALALTALADGSLTGLRGTGEAARRMQALTLAQSHLSAASDRPGLIQPGQRDGEDQAGLHWTVKTTPLATAAAGGVDTARPLVLYAIRVTVSWPGTFGRRRSISLETRRAGPPPPGTGG